MNTITISEDIIEDVAKRISRELKTIEADYISHDYTLKELEKYCNTCCKYPVRDRHIVCSSCILHDAIDIVDCIPTMYDMEEKKRKAQGKKA